MKVNELRRNLSILCFILIFIEATFFTQQASADQVLVGAPSSNSNYYGLYTPYGTSASFTLSGSDYVSTIDVVLYTPTNTNFPTFNFTLQNSLTGSITTLASASLTVPSGSSISTEVMNINNTLSAGTYYLVGVVPGYFGTTVTAGNVDGRFMSNGIYNNSAGVVTDGVWGTSDGSTWTLASGNYYNNGTMYYAPAFSVNAPQFQPLSLVQSGCLALVY